MEGESRTLKIGGKEMAHREGVIFGEEIKLAWGISAVFFTCVPLHRSKKNCVWKPRILHKIFKKVSSSEQEKIVRNLSNSSKKKSLQTPAYIFQRKNSHRLHKLRKSTNEIFIEKQLYSDYFGYHFTCCHSSSSSSSSSSSLPAPAIVLSLLLPGAEADAISPDPRSSFRLLPRATRQHLDASSQLLPRAFSITVPGHAHILLIGTFLFSTSTAGLDPGISANGKKQKSKHCWPYWESVLLFENERGEKLSHRYISSINSRIYDSSRS